MSSAADRRASIAIDIHAHIMLPELYAVTVGHSAFGKSVTDPSMSAEARKKAKERSDFVCARMADVTERIGEMDRMGVDIQILSASLVHQCTYWAEPKESLRLERKLNDHIAKVAAA